MVVRHHSLPFAACHHIIIIRGQLGIFLQHGFNAQTVAHGGMVVYFCHVGARHHRIIYQLIVSVLHLLRQLRAQVLCPLDKRLPALRGYQHLVLIEDTRYLHLWFSQKIIFAVLGYQVSHLTGVLLSEDASGKTFQPCLLITRLNGIRIPCIVHNEIDRYFLWLQVAHVDNPDAVDATGVCLMQLLAELRDGGGVHPAVVPRTAIHINMVIQAQSTLALSLFRSTLAADIAPVVVAEEQGYIVGHGEPGIIVALHLGKDGPELRHLTCRLAISLPDDSALCLNHLTQGLDILGIIAIAHRHVSITSHTDGHQVFILGVALHAVHEELIQTIWVSSIVP